MINLINGEMLNELAKLEKASIDLVFADLPYGQTDCEWDNKIDLEKLWIQLKRVSKTNTAFIFFCTTKFGYELIKSNEKWFKYDLVWDKTNTCGFLNAKKMPMRQHEMVYIFYNKLPLYNIADNHVHNPKMTKEQKRLEGGVYANSIVNNSVGVQYEPKLPTSILDFKTSKTRKIQKHPTEKPIDLFEWFLKYYTNKESKVLDICFGSGNSALACKNLERDYIGFELNEKFYDNAKKSLEDN
jgi:site-specific DNA-methyltransferase (adenine-specific)